MATTAPNGNLISMPVRHSALPHAARRVAVRRARKITPEAGRAIEMLGHAIEYLTDEFALDCINDGMGHPARTTRGLHPRMAAIELLMARNREIYFSCPEQPTFSERFRSLLGWQRA